MAKPFGQSERCPIHLMGFPDHFGKFNSSHSYSWARIKQIKKPGRLWTEIKEIDSLWSNGERCSNDKNRLPCSCYLKTTTKEPPFPLAPSQKNPKKPNTHTHTKRNQAIKKAKRKNNQQNNCFGSPGGEACIAI